MRRISVVAAAAMMLAASPARADEPQVSGVVVYGSGSIQGEITATDGTPLAGVAVHVVGSSGREQIVTTDRAGRYRVPRRGGDYALVFVQREARVGARTATPALVDGEEVIEVHEAVPPAVMPKAKTPGVVPAYTDAAIEHNVWTRSWLLLDIDARGTVTRIKSLVTAGHDLDRNGWREAFALGFEPARDRAGRPTRALLLWTYEWPSYWWMSENRFRPNRLPGAVARVPCRGSGPTRTLYRDCRQADMTRIFTSPWIERPR